MKPTTKKLIFCPACQRPKMQFPTEGKANRFLKYNTDEILEESGRAPIRSYYCPMCCAWHVTSTPESYSEVLDSRDRHKMKLLHSHEISDTKSAKINQLLDSAKIYLMQGLIEQSENIVKKAEAIYSHMSFCDDKTSQRLTHKHKLIDAFVSITLLPEDQRKVVFSSIQGNADLTMLKIAYENYVIIEKFVKAETELRSAAKDGNKTECTEALHRIEEMKFKFKGIYKSKLKHDFEVRVKLIRDEFSHLIINEKEKTYRSTLLYVIERLEELPRILEEGSIALGRYIISNCKKYLGSCESTPDTILLRQTVDLWDNRFTPGN